MKALKASISHFWEVRQMYRMLCGDLRRLFKSKIFYMALVLYAFIYTSSTPFIMWVIGLFTHQAPDYADMELKGQPGTAAIAISIFIATFIIKEFSEGAIRNKLSSGAKRSEIFLSSVITMSVAAVMIQAVSLLSIIISGNTLMAGFLSSPKEIIVMNVYYIIAVVSIAIFDTALIYILGGNHVSLFVGAVISVIMKLAAIMVLEDLYPETGETLISGSRLAVFSFIDKYIPYMHLAGFPRFGWSAYVIGGGGLIILSLLIGLVVFEKKDIK